MSVQAGSSRSGIDPRILKEAAQWLTRFQSNDIDDAAKAQWLHWKGASPDHALAWEKAERLLGMIRTVPPEFSTTLDRPARLNRRQLVKAAVATAFIGPGVWLGHRYLDGEAGWPTTSPVGSTTTLALGNGASLALNTDTALKMTQGAEGRRIHLLRGELLLDVPAGSAAAGVATTVATGDGWLRMQEGRLNLRRRDNGSDLAVLRGAADLFVAQRVAAVPVRAMQQARFADGQVQHVGPASDVVTGWVNGVIYAEDMPLADFIEEVARYRHGYVICDPAIAGLRISGTFHLADTDRILTALQNTLPVSVRFKTRYWVSVVPAKAAVTT